jgi:hypothetical protein
VDNAALVSRILEEGDPVAEGDEIGFADGREMARVAPSSDCWVAYGLDDRYYIVKGDGESPAPLGMWEVVGTVPAQQDDQYIVLTPTLSDSSDTVPYSAYYISAHTTTPSIFFDSPVDSGYSVDNIAPGVPQGFAAAYNTGSGNQLTWDPAPEPDFQYFKIYRDADPNFVPAPGNLADATATTSWTDSEFDGGMVYYKITALDHVGNESGAASPESVTGLDGPVIPARFALYQNAPNPFNPETLIRYDVPAGGGPVSLRIYDVGGRLVRVLIDGTQAPGAKRILWNGRNDRGEAVATGVYFYRLNAPEFEQTRKMLLLR